MYSYSGAVYKCVSKHKHCTLNHNIYSGPEDPTVLQHQLAQQCDGKNRQYKLTWQYSDL